MSDAGPTQIDLDMLWQRLEDAKLQLDLAHNYVREVTGDLKAGAVPPPDGNFAYRHALQAEALAAENYLKILNRYKAILLEGSVPDGTERDST
jgi:hypothetical protein